MENHPLYTKIQSTLDSIRPYLIADGGNVEIAGSGTFNGVGYVTGNLYDKDSFFTTHPPSQFGLIILVQLVLMLLTFLLTKREQNN